jgi:uncharacterized linocin/CFP29 family protein
MADLNWSDAQWQKVKDAVTEAFGKASVASAFLPLYGPLPGSTETVRNERLTKKKAGTPPTITVGLDTDHAHVNLKLVNVTVNVLLSSEQVAEETLSNALLAFRRAANILAQEEDRIVFGGFRRGPRGEDSEYVANEPKPQKGLADLRARRDFDVLTNAAGAAADLVQDRKIMGQFVVSAVVDAIRRLEGTLHPSPFACVLGNELFNRVHDPSKSLVLPADRITPLLKGGPLLRSGKMDGNTGIVVSLAGNAVDIVIGTPPTVQFLQRQSDAKFLFRVYERFVLRIRDAVTPPVAGFRIRPTEAERIGEAQRLEELARQEAALPNAEWRLAVLDRVNEEGGGA